MAVTGMLSPQGLLLCSLCFSALLILYKIFDEARSAPPCTSSLVEAVEGGLNTGKASSQLIPRRTYKGLDAAYAQEAAANLSVWRAGVFQRTTEFLATQKIIKIRSDRKKTLITHVEPFGHLRFTGTDAFITCPPGQDLIRWGEGDGGKFVCGLNLLKAPCMVLSIGSFNNYDFEECVLKATPCQVATFDCTVDGRDIDKRHKFYKKCLGSEVMAKADKDYITIEQAADMAGTREIALLKMDIEGFEFDILGAWREDMTGLPQQLCLEVHYIASFFGGHMYTHPEEGKLPERREVMFSELALFFNHMADLGYGIVSREDNELSRVCSEYTFFRVA